MMAATLDEGTDSHFRVGAFELARLRTCFIDQGISLIRVFRTAADIANEDLIESHREQVEPKIRADFAKIWNVSGTSRLISTLHQLSTKHKMTTGKWLISRPWDKADEAFDSIKNALIDGKFSDEVRFIKVYGRQEDEKNPHFRAANADTNLSYNAMISIMTKNWTNKEKTMQVAMVAKEAGVDFKLRYKPDICTTLEIYRGNGYGIRPTVYTI